MTLEIGNKKLKDISRKELLELIIIEGVTAVIEFWSYPIITEFNNTMFGEVICIDYYSIRLKDELKSEPIEFYFNHVDLTFHYTQNGRNNHGNSHRLKIESIKYLIKQGYDVPIY